MKIYDGNIDIKTREFNEEPFIKRSKLKGMYIDGVIDISKWNNLRKEKRNANVLFILKEPYKNKESEDTEDEPNVYLYSYFNCIDLKSEKGSGIKGPTWRNIAKMKSILCGEEPPKSMDNFSVLKEIQDVAFINIKKTGGGTRSKLKKVYQS